MTLMTHIPSFTLGAVYMVFYTGGEWDVSPIVGGELGVFQVLKSRTLGYEMVLDYYGNVVVGIADESLKTLPFTPGSSTHEKSEIAIHEDMPSAKQTDQVEIDRDSIYTEEYVKRMLASQEDVFFDTNGASATRTFAAIAVRDPSIHWGNNSANRVTPFTIHELHLGPIVGVDVQMGGSGGIDNLTDITPTPEPGTLILVGLSVGGLAWRRRRKQQRAAV